MRNLLLLAMFLTAGCVDNSVRGANLDGSVGNGTFSKVKFEGHIYIVYSEGAIDHRIGGLEHDPECFTCRNRR